MSTEDFQAKVLDLLQGMAADMAEMRSDLDEIHSTLDRFDAAIDRTGAELAAIRAGFDRDSGARSRVWRP